MARQGKSTAFRRGFLLAGIAAAGATVWNAPQAGARTREQIVETVEGALFAVLDMKDKLTTIDTPAAPVVPPEPPRPIPVLSVPAEFAVNY